MVVGEKVVLCYENGSTETISLPEFGNIVITIQNGKIYKIDKSETQIKKRK
ncbi:DUF2292 domain-containing protein [Enterococcus gallinarum]|nr:DUF2292 domain-containing protein [Enterococcus gallinarum]